MQSDQRRFMLILRPFHGLQVQRSNSFKLENVLSVTLDIDRKLITYQYIALID